MILIMIGLLASIVYAHFFAESEGCCKPDSSTNEQALKELLMKKNEQINELNVMYRDLYVAHEQLQEQYQQQEEELKRAEETKWNTYFNTFDEIHPFRAGV